MKVLVADKFEKSGHRRPEGRRLRGRLRAGPEGRRAGRGHRARRAPTCWSSASTQVTEPMLEAGRLSLDRARRRRLQHDRRAGRVASAASTCRTVPGKNSIAVAELAFGLILALDRRIPDNVAGAARGKWNKKEYSKAAGLYGRDARPARLRQHRPGGGEARAGASACTSWSGARWRGRRPRPCRSTCRCSCRCSRR